MLSNPKRKVAWSLNPRGHFWSKDETKIGQKILEKMGWQKGKGLGKFENGSIDAIKATSKRDGTGIGWNVSESNFNPRQTDFNTLLSSLNQSYSVNTMHENLSSAGPVSLEDKSKNSRNRVHYKKFISGKDISQYSEGDLECIFGKKTSGISNVSKDEGFSFLENLDPCPSSEGPAVCSNYQGVKTYTSTTNLTDYFSRKLKNCGANNLKEDECEVADDSPGVEMVEQPARATSHNKRKRKKKKEKRKAFESYELSSMDQSIHAVNSNDCHCKKKGRVDVLLITEQNRETAAICNDDNLKSCLKGSNSTSSVAQSKTVVFNDCVFYKSITPEKQGPDKNSQDYISSSGGEEPKVTVCDLKSEEHVLVSNSDSCSSSTHSQNMFTLSQLEAVVRIKNEWSNSIKMAEKMSHYGEVIGNILKHEILNTTNLLEIRGYGN